jgi:beta-glucanase (GH16 family)
VTRAGAAILGLSLALPGCGSTKAPVVPAVTPPPGASWTLSWGDEFEGPAGATVDATKWTFDVGGGGWGNQELQSYTDQPRNAHLTETASRHRRAAREPTGPDRIAREFTSARLKTQASSPRFTAASRPASRSPRAGIWPAFWMLATTSDVSWPACGEIDIMENIGREPAIVHGTVHGPGYSGAGGIGAPYSLPDGAPFADDFHVFAVEWEPSSAGTWTSLYLTRTPADLPAGTRWAFDHPFFLIVNVAVGGAWPGNPDGTTAFPQHMLVDYVRVYKR